jgi:hypothetical protein
MSLEGRLEDLGLADIFQIISLSKRSGVLTIVRKEGTGRLVFSMGQLVHASSDSKSRLGYNLIKEGSITTEELEKALRFQKSQGQRVPLGTVLVKMGAISQEGLEKAIRDHLVEVVKDIMSWDRGSFHFELGTTIQDDIIFSGGLTTDFLLLEAARRQDEDQRTKGSSHLKGEKESTSPHGGRPDHSEKTPIPSAKGKNSAGPSLKKDATPVPSPDDTDSSIYPANTSIQSRKDLDLLNAMIEELSAPTSSSEITLLVLRYASELMARAFIFLVRKEDVVGLGQFGLNITSPDDRVRGIKIPLSEPSIFQDAVNRKVPYKGPVAEGKWNRNFLDSVGGGSPREAFVSPLISEGRVIALLYGDNLPNQEEIGPTEGLETFIKVAAFAFGKAMLERKLLEKERQG